MHHMPLRRGSHGRNWFQATSYVLQCSRYHPVTRLFEHPVLSRSAPNRSAGTLQSCFYVTWQCRLSPPVAQTRQYHDCYTVDFPHCTAQRIVIGRQLNNTLNGNNKMSDTGTVERSKCLTHTRVLHLAFRD